MGSSATSTTSQSSSMSVLVSAFSMLILMILLKLPNVAAATTKSNMASTLATRDTTAATSDSSKSVWMMQRRMGLGYGDTIPAAPVQGQATSCSLDLSDQLLGGVKVACMMGELDRRHCCPVLAAWLMAARAKVALNPPLPQQPGMPLLPDDSLVCIASLKSALFSRGITLTPPNSSCDVVTCFCGIKLNHITSQSCPLPFSNGNSGGHNSSSASATYQPATIIPNPVINVSTVETDPVEVLPSGALARHRHDIIPSKALPLQPTTNTSSSPSTSTAKMNTTGSISAKGNMSDLLQALALNCTDHSYIGCTRCLKTLRKEISSSSARALGVTGSNAKSLNCEMIGLMWLLHMNKTFYIPTVSAVVRALVYNNHKCSPDTENMPLALDYSEILAKSNNGSSSVVSISSSYQALLLLLLLVIFTSAFLNQYSCM